MTDTIDRVIVVGGSVAGASAAFALREAGFAGSVTLVGEERHLPYERPPLSKGYLRGEEPAEKGEVRPPAAYDREGIALLVGRRASRIDRSARRVALDDGTALRYDRVILATGSAARELDVPGRHLDGVYRLRTIDDADALRGGLEAAARVVVVGGGWIGSEVAASLTQMGAAVTMVASARPLEAALGARLGGVYAELHRANGVELVTGRVGALEGSERVEAVRLTDGRVLAADLVVAGVGAAPRAELAAEAGLELAGGAVAVDELLRSSDPRILAAGDVAAAWNPRYGGRLRVEHWDNAKRQGAVAARNALDAGEAYDRVPYFYSDQFDLGMEIRGRTAGADEVVIRGDLTARTFLAFWIAGGRVVAAMNANIWDAGKTISALVRDAARVDPARLADASAPIEAAA